MEAPEKFGHHTAAELKAKKSPALGDVFKALCHVTSEARPSPRNAGSKPRDCNWESRERCGGQICWV